MCSPCRPRGRAPASRAAPLRMGGFRYGRHRSYVSRTALHPLVAGGTWRKPAFISSTRFGQSPPLPDPDPPSASATPAPPTSMPPATSAATGALSSLPGFLRFFCCPVIGCLLQFRERPPDGDARRPLCTQNRAERRRARKRGKGRPRHCRNHPGGKRDRKGPGNIPTIRQSHQRGMYPRSGVLLQSLSLHPCPPLMGPLPVLPLVLGVEGVAGCAGVAGALYWGALCCGAAGAVYVGV